MGHIYPWYLVVYEVTSPDGLERFTERFDRYRDADKRFQEIMHQVKTQSSHARHAINVDLFGSDCLASCRPDSHPNAPLQSS